ncbi:MAG: SBBP repeat-containing protein, partial [Chloroflexota bacterium]|nr:SBBP repeat-containing protein [Chloroflexota bacterium]
SSLLFVENVGQFDERARFQVRGGAGTMWLAEDALWISITEHVEPSKRPTAQTCQHADLQLADLQPANLQVVNLKLSLVGANPHPRIEPFDRQINVIHYYRGNDPSQWHTDVPVWGGVRYRDVYPGVDLEVTGESGRWVWRLVVHDSQFDISNVRLLVEGSETVAAQDGYLHLTTEVGDFTLPLLSVEGSAPAGRPAAARTANETFEIAAPFSAVTPNSVASPQVSYPEEAYFGSYLGGNDWDWAYDVAVGGQGDILNRDGDFTSGESRSIWIAGSTLSSDFPDEPGGTALSGVADAFVTKMKRGALYVDPDFSAYIGGSDQDSARGIAADASGNVYVAGWTKSSDFATSGNPYDASYNGCTDAFVLKLASDGNLLYASYLGGSYVTIPGLGDQCGDDDGTAIAVDAQDIVYLTGSTYSQDFPTTPGAYDTVFSYFDVGLSKDTFVAKLDLSKGASGLLYSTFVGGGTISQGEDIAIDGSGNVYVTGNAEGGPDGRNFFPTTQGAYNEVFTTGD